MVELSGHFTLDFLSGIETLAHCAWLRVNPHGAWSSMPPPSASGAYVPGWDRDDGWMALLTDHAHQAARPDEREIPPASNNPPVSPDVADFLSEPDDPPSVQPRTSRRDPSLMPHDMLPHMDTLYRAVEKLTAELSHRPLGCGDASGWLATAAGDPHTYDAPDSDRKGVCVRVLPTTYAQLQQLQRTLGLRTTAGAWELLLRLGFAAVERLQPA